MSVADKLDAARHSLSGCNIAKAICKASSREVMGPKKKHVDYILLCTENEHIDLANMAVLLFERCRMSSWVIVSKALVTFHNLMSAGNERFLQHMGSRTTLWDLENFHDKSAVVGYDMSAFIRRYSNFLTQKAKSYTEMNYDFCRVKRGNDGVLRTCDTPKLLKALAEIQTLFDTLLEVDLQSSEFNNGVINSAFVLLFKDMIKLFACYNDGVINLLESYFHMDKDDCKQSLDIYKKFASRIDNIKNFLKVAEDVGVNENAIPELIEAPSGLLVALENHYQSLEKGKVPPSTTEHPNLAPIVIPLDSEKITLAEREAETQIISEDDEETNAQITLLETSQTTPPHAAAAAASQDTWQSLFEPNESKPKSTSNSNSDDLLALHAVSQAQQSSSETFPPNSNFGQTTGFNVGGGSSGFQPAGAGFSTTQPDAWSTNISYTGHISNNNDSNPFETNSDIRSGYEPASQTHFADVLQPMNRPQPQVQQQQTVTSTGDLQSTLSKVTKSLDDFDLFPSTTTSSTGTSGYQWAAPKPKPVKTGGANFQIGSTSGTTLPPTSPMSPTGSVLPPTSPVGGMVRQQPIVRPGSAQPPMFGVQQQPMMRPQANMFAQKNTQPVNPFGNPAMGNQATNEW